MPSFLHGRVTTKEHRFGDTLPSVERKEPSKKWRIERDAVNNRGHLQVLMTRIGLV